MGSAYRLPCGNFLFQLLGKIFLDDLQKACLCKGERALPACLPACLKTLPIHPGQGVPATRNRKNFIEMKVEACLYLIKPHKNERTSFSLLPSTHMVSESFKILSVFLFLNVIKLVKPKFCFHYERNSRRKLAEFSNILATCTNTILTFSSRTRYSKGSW